MANYKVEMTKQELDELLKKANNNGYSGAQDAFAYDIIRAVEMEKIPEHWKELNEKFYNLLNEFIYLRKRKESFDGGFSFGISQP